MNTYTLQTLINTEVIALNQDPFGIQASKIRDYGDQEVFAKELSDGSWGIALLNRGSSIANITVNWQDLGVSWVNALVRDMWRHQDLGIYSGSFLTNVLSHEAVILRVTPTDSQPPVNLPPEGTITSPASNVTISVGETVTFAGAGTDPDANLPLSYLWKFGTGSGVADSAVQNPGAIQFNNAGTFTVTLTATDSLGLSETTPDFRVVTVQSATSGVLPRTGWRIAYVDSQETVGEKGAATNVLDGIRSTMWHTQWYRKTAALPHEIQIDMGKTYTVTGFRYLPRQDGGVNGTIRNYEFYVSTSRTNWGTAASRGSFASNTQEKEVTFSAKTGRYIRLRALSEINGKAWTSAAEITVLGK
jgi:PKD repeat protein